LSRSGSGRFEGEFCFVDEQIVDVQIVDDFSRKIRMGSRYCSWSMKTRPRKQEG
jgi:hypothetical protein